MGTWMKGLERGGETSGQEERGFVPASLDARRAGRRLQPAAGAWQDNLARIIEVEILPQLMMAGAAPETPVSSDAPRNSGLTPELDLFTRHLRAPGSQPSMAYIDTLRALHWPPEQICLNLLAPAARRLGELWKSDACDFIDVSVGLRRLHAILSQWGAEQDFAPSPSAARRALFATVPGDGHLFGIAILERFFAADGWEILPAGTRDCTSLLAD